MRLWSPQPAPRSGSCRFSQIWLLPCLTTSLSSWSSRSLTIKVLWSKYLVTITLLVSFEQRTPLSTWGNQWDKINKRKDQQNIVNNNPEGNKIPGGGALESQGPPHHQVLQPLQIELCSTITIESWEVLVLNCDKLWWENIATGKMSQATTPFHFFRFYPPTLTTFITQKYWSQDIKPWSHKKFYE